MSGNANTSKTGTSKLVTDPGHAMHIVVKKPTYDEFRRWCHENGTTPTQKARALVEEFVASLTKEN